MKTLQFAFCLLFVTLLCSCGGQYPSYPSGVDKVDSFVSLLNNRYMYDSNYYVVKRPEDTATQGFVVIYSADTGYVAYDIQNYSAGQSWSSYSSYAEYQPVYITGTSYDSYSHETFYFGDAYKNNYYGYGSYAGEFVFDETSEAGKDLEKAAALVDAHKTAKIGEALSSEFGLSEERGIRIAKLVSDWKKLSKSRSMTSADANVFSKEVLGMEMDKAQSALVKHVQGDSSEINELVQKAAKVNGTSPEHMSELLNMIFVPQA